jgi:competence protein ComEC
MNPFARFPFLRYVLPFIGGIILGVYSEPTPLPCFSFLGISGLAILLFCYSAYLRTKYALRYFFAATLQLFWVSLGVSLASISDERENKSHFQNIPDKQFLLVKLKEPLARKPRTLKANARVTGVITSKGSLQANGNLLIYVQYDSSTITSLYCGDEILVPASAQEIPGPMNPGEFNYKKFLAYHHVHHQLFLKSTDWQLLHQGNSFELLRIVYRVRDLLLGILNTYIDDRTERGVAGALLFGYKEELESDVVDAYARTGTLHVLAVSGMHVAILYFVVSFLLKPLEKRKAGVWLRAGLTLFLIWFYSLLSGMAPSIIRASVMFTLIILGKALRDDISIYNNLFTSACLLLCYDPWYLFDAGFQLSYLAVFGIVYFQPKFSRFLIFRSRIAIEAWNLITVSIAAQLATLPISLYYFNQFPNFFIISNLLIIPLTTLIMYAGILLIVVCKITPLATLLGFCINKLIALADFLIFKIQALPFAVTEGIYFTMAEAVLLAAIILLLSVYFIHARKFYFFASLLLGLGLVISSSLRRAENSVQHMAILYSIPGNFALNIFEGKTNRLFCDSMLQANPAKIKTRLKGFWNSRGTSPAKVSGASGSYRSPNFILTRDYFVSPQYIAYFIDGSTQLPGNGVLEVDQLVLRHGCHIPLALLKRHFEFSMLVLDGSLRPWIKEKYKSEALTMNIKCHDLRTDGALMLWNR